MVFVKVIDVLLGPGEERVACHLLVGQLVHTHGTARADIASACQRLKGKIKSIWQDSPLKGKSTRGKEGPTKEKNLIPDQMLQLVFSK